jgi:arsenate reductase
MLFVYGIKQCDTCRKALKWLEARGVPHQFHDMRSHGLEQGMIEDWLASEFSGRLVNRSSTTWRGLSDSQKNSKGPQLVRLLLDNPTLIKRPVFVDGQVLAVGFAPDKLATGLGIASE